MIFNLKRNIRKILFNLWQLQKRNQLQRPTDEKKVVEQPKTEQKAAVETPKNEPTISLKDYEKVLKENSKMKDEISALKKKISSIMEQLSLNESALERKSQECERLKHRTFSFWQRPIKLKHL